MRRIREAFDKSEAQLAFFASDLEITDDNGKPLFRRKQAEKRRDNRFTAMLTDLYGGSFCIREYLRSGLIVDQRTPPLQHQVAPRNRRDQPKAPLQSGSRAAISRQQRMYWIGKA